MKSKTLCSAAVLGIGIGISILSAAASAAAPPDATLPAGFNVVVDDTGTIQVVVPDSWIDRDLAPAVADDGTPIPYIEASPDRAVFVESFDQPGVTFVAHPFVADPQELIDQYGLTAGCTNFSVEPYTDAVYTGLVQIGTDCGANGATWKMVAASPADQTFTAMVQVQTASAADDVAMEIVLGTFDRVQGATVPAGSVPAGSIPAVTIPAVTVPTVPSTPGSLPQVPGVVSAPGTNPTGYAGNTVLLSSEGGEVSIEVPDMWSAVQYQPNTATGGGSIDATTDAAGFLGDGAPGLVAPGVRVIWNPASDSGVTTEDSVTFLSAAYDEDCVKNGPEPLAFGDLTGHVVVLASCSGGTTGRAVFVGTTSTGAQLALVIQLLDIDDTALDLLLETVTRNG